jgi:hypothetical protein
MKQHAGRRVIVRELGDAVAELRPIQALDARGLDRFDILICVLGFEERALAVPKALADAGHTVAQTAICHYRTNPDDNVKNEQPLLECLGQMCQRDPVDLQADGDLGTELRSLVGGTGGLRVGLDISVASSSLIIRAVAVLLETDIELHILYAEADQYRPTKKEHETSHGGPADAKDVELARGVLDVSIVSELPGSPAVGFQERVVVFPGFDRDRVRAAISQVDTDFIMELDRAPITWMIGQPLHPEDRWRQQALAELHGIPDGHEQKTVDTFDFRESMFALEDVYRRRALDANITVVPLGSKMQAVGVTLFCVARRDVAVMVSQPTEYVGTAYSRGARALWHLPLGSTAAACNALRSVDTIRLEDLQRVVS